MTNRSTPHPGTLPISRATSDPHAFTSQPTPQTERARAWHWALRSFFAEVVNFWADEIVYATMDTLRVVAYLRSDLPNKTHAQVGIGVTGSNETLIEPITYKTGKMMTGRVRM